MELLPPRETNAQAVNVMEAVRTPGIHLVRRAGEPSALILSFAGWDEAQQLAAESSRNPFAAISRFMSVLESHQNALQSTQGETATTPAPTAGSQDFGPNPLQE